MSKEPKSFSFNPLPKLHAPTPEEENPSEFPSTKVSALIPYNLIEQLKDFCYWEGYTQSEAQELAIRLFLSDKNPKPRPEKIKQKKKTGRKPKST